MSSADYAEPMPANASAAPPLRRSLRAPLRWCRTRAEMVATTPLFFGIFLLDGLVGWLYLGAIFAGWVVWTLARPRPPAEASSAEASSAVALASIPTERRAAAEARWAAGAEAALRERAEQAAEYERAAEQRRREGAERREAEAERRRLM